MNVQARQYQVDAENGVITEWQKGIKRTLLVLPTGCGKTIVFCLLIEKLVRQGMRVLILAHRGELLDQAADKLSRSTGLGCAVEKADQSCHGELFRVVVGSVQTLMRQKRLETFEPDYFDVIIVDEAHHCISDSYQRVLQYFSEAYVLGVTATPDRGDMRDMGEYFESLAYEYSLPQAVSDGFLAPIKAMTIPLQIDISSVGQQNGDYKASDLGGALLPYLEKIADEMVMHASGRKTVVFLPLISTSKLFCDILKSKGFRAAEVNGKSEDREQILKDFDDWTDGVLCNSMLLTEGWDCPSVDCIVVLRPTKVRALYSQMVGRGTRLHPGKDHLLLLDFLWNVKRLELCRPASLIAQTQDVADRMTDAINTAGAPVDIMETEQEAERDCVAEREQSLARKLAEQRNKKRALVDPLQFEMSIMDIDLSNFTPAFGWEAKPPTDRQREIIERAGISTVEIDNAGKASLLISTIGKRRAAGLSTPKQIRQLEGRGFEHVGSWSFEAAKNMIGRIAANGWRTPNGVDPATYKPKSDNQKVAVNE